MKIGHLFRVLFQDPGEFSDRVLTALEFQADRVRSAASMAATDFNVLVRAMGSATGVDLNGFLQDDALREIESRIESARTMLSNGAAKNHDAANQLARMCYAVCRAVEPEVVVETGVGNGVTSSYFLQAMKVNGKGGLWSIDLPPLGAISGLMVPDDLRSRWRLLRGRTRKLLPKLIGELGSVDIFLHDSLHTYRNMSFEFETVWPALRNEGVMLSDDVTMNQAFEKFAASHPNRFAASSASPVFGVVVKERIPAVAVPSLKRIQ